MLFFSLKVLFNLVLTLDKFKIKLFIVDWDLNFIQPILIFFLNWVQTIYYSTSIHLLFIEIIFRNLCAIIFFLISLIQFCSFNYSNFKVPSFKFLLLPKTKLLRSIAAIKATKYSFNLNQN